MTDSSGSVETPSGKGSGDENFPVGSFLLPRRLRPHVAVFYAYARGIDDIADNPDLEPDDKVARLDRMAAGIEGRETEDPALITAFRMRRSLLETGITTKHCLDLVSAFQQDATKLRYDDWPDLLDYCDRSANPVGRYLLDLHGESREGYPASDALCSALQVLNHLQDCKDDYLDLDRVYLPGDWMAENGTRVEELDAAAASPGMRRVLDLCLEGTEGLVRHSRELPARLDSLHLGMESAVIVRIAEVLTERLKRQDPIAERVELSKPQFLWCGLSGAVVEILCRLRPGAKRLQPAREGG